MIIEDNSLEILFKNSIYSFRMIDNATLRLKKIKTTCMEPFENQNKNTIFAALLATY